MSIHLTQWAQPTNIDGELIDFGERLKDVIFETRKYKSEHNLSMRAEMDVLEIHTERLFMEWFKQTEKDMLACSRAKTVKYVLKNAEK